MIPHAERENLVVVYAEQDRGQNPMACWNWFRPGDQGRDDGEPAILTDLAQSVATEHGIGTDRVFAAGLSAGGAMAAILGAVRPDVFRAVGIHSGLAPGAATDVAGAYAAMRGQGTRRSGDVAVRTIIFHGTADSTVHPGNAAQVLDAALAGTPTVAVEDRSVPGAVCALHRDGEGRTLAEAWSLDGVGHAWSGGSPEGSYVHPDGPDASAEMVRFFLAAAASH